MLLQAMSEEAAEAYRQAEESFLAAKMHVQMAMDAPGQSAAVPEAQYHAFNQVRRYD